MCLMTTHQHTRRQHHFMCTNAEVHKCSHTCTAYSHESEADSATTTKRRSDKDSAKIMLKDAEIEKILLNGVSIESIISSCR